MSDLKEFDIKQQKKSTKQDLSSTITSHMWLGFRELGKTIGGKNTKTKNAKGSKIIYSKKQINKKEEKREEQLKQKRKTKTNEQ